MPMSRPTLLERRQHVLGRHAILFYDEPLHLVRGEGVWVYDAEGRRYLDVYNNVPHVGHCHPHVVEALCKQASILNLHTRYLHENVVEYAERLTSTFDDALSTAMFCCTGTEANELALRISRFCTGNKGIIVSNFSYHGNSAALAEATTGLPAPEALAPHVRAVPIPDPYRAPAGQSLSDLADEYAGYVELAVKSLQEAGFGVSALLIDTLFSTEGLLAVPPGYLEKAVEHVRRAGGLFIADEVQPGFGRTGEHMWGHQSYDVVPDFVTLGKPMGNGHPLAGMITRSDLVEAFSSKALYFNTFGGNPVSSAVGMAVLDVIERERLVDNAHNVGQHVRQGLLALKDKHDIIGDVRGKGLFFGIELVKDRATKEPASAETRRLVNLLRERGILISKIGPAENILKMRPPMVFTKENADLLLSTLDMALAEL